ncbi:MAG TPA: hypothetical protein VFV62_02445 [Gaiellaceae bacterium]|nr:hypothetical protein [Gaiellaceae bacterium]
MRLIYLLFGLSVLAGASYADHRGLSFMRTTEIRNVPKSIRDNPGAYRSLYRGSSRSFGGK